MSMTSGEPILEALETQVGCYRRLARLAEQQHLFVQSGQTDELLKTLQKRQEVLDQITGCERTIGPVKPRWAAFVADLPPARKSVAESMMSETRKLLEQITTSDRNDSIVLQQRRANLGRQINKTMAAKVINRKYTASAYGVPGPARLDVQQ
jgi:hypothetical protein